MTNWGFESVPGEGSAPLVLTVSRSPACASELSFTLPNGRTANVLLAGRYTRLLLCLVAAWHVDSDRCPLMRGLREGDVIGVSLARMPHADGQVEADTVKSYVSAIRRAIKAAARAIDPRLVPPDPFETRRSDGYRIGTLGLTIAWEPTRGVVGGHSRVRSGNPSRARRSASFVHLSVHRAVEASASSSTSKGRAT